MIYLDNAATSAIKPKSVITALYNATSVPNINAGRGAHSKSIAIMNDIMNTAEEIAELIGAEDSSRIAFTQNATYALNFAIFGVLKPDDHIIVTSMEHNSVLRPAYKHGNKTVVYADEMGYIDPINIENAITDDTKLIVCTHISNVTGSIQPIKKIGDIAHKHDILFLVDAAQSIGLCDINIKRDNIDMLAFSGHKGLMGPQGTGALYVREGIEINPIIVGGTGSLSEQVVQPDFMPDILQSGTVNTPAIIALGEGVRFVKKYKPDVIGEHERMLAQKFIMNIENIKNVKFYGSDDSLRNGTVAFNIDGIDASEVEDRLDREFGIIVRAGYHCSPLAHKTIGTFETGAVRASFGFYSTDNDCKKIVNAIYKIAHK